MLGSEEVCYEATRFSTFQHYFHKSGPRLTTGSSSVPRFLPREEICTCPWIKCSECFTYMPVMRRIFEVNAKSLCGPGRQKFGSSAQSSCPSSKCISATKRLLADIIVFDSAASLSRESCYVICTCEQAAPASPRASLTTGRWPGTQADTPERLQHSADHAVLRPRRSKRVSSYRATFRSYKRVRCLCETLTRRLQGHGL